jgi:ubiquinone/menaquinone biosynthesis C-methylase UbiE
MKTDVNQMDPIERFSKRARYYDKYRPKYPIEIIELLRRECSLLSSSIIADVGSGTGILSRLFLTNKNTVFGIEPNKEMRKIAEKLLKKYSNFKSVNGTAESTNLGNQSVDFIIAGQAFHWFNIYKSKEEFLRILKPEGWVVLIWNERRTGSTPFLKAYDDLLYTFGTDYKKVCQQIPDTKIFAEFFGYYPFKIQLYHNLQVFDFEGLKGRVLSSSYAPMKDHPNYRSMIAELHKIFLQFQTNGKVKFEYLTKIYYGQLE